MLLIISKNLVCLSWCRWGVGVGVGVENLWSVGVGVGVGHGKIIYKGVGVGVEQFFFDSPALDKIV